MAQRQTPTKHPETRRGATGVRAGMRYAPRVTVHGAQASLFGRERPSCDETFGSLRRVVLDRGAWIDLAPSWLAGHVELFDHLVRETTWRSDEREMYERLVAVPRLVAEVSVGATVHPVIRRMQQILGARYQTELSRISFAYYRDGRDSVAWHGDQIARRLPEAIVATVSVGAPRRFLVRPYGGGCSTAFSLGWGDLVVMGGTCQRTHQHAVPKVARAQPRISIMFRPIWPTANLDENTSDRDEGST